MRHDTIYALFEEYQKQVLGEIPIKKVVLQCIKWPLVLLSIALTIFYIAVSLFAANGNASWMAFFLFLIAIALIVFFAGVKTKKAMKGDVLAMLELRRERTDALMRRHCYLTQDTIPLLVSALGQVREELRRDADSMMQSAQVIIVGIIGTAGISALFSLSQGFYASAFAMLFVTGCFGLSMCLLELLYSSSRKLRACNAFLNYLQDTQLSLHLANDGFKRK